MDNGKLFNTPAALSWQLFDAPPQPELNSTPPSYLNLNWDHSMTDNAQFESALSSAISSPTSAAPAAESVVIRELIGRLGSICNSGEISPTSRYHSTNTSCYSTPINSPPKLNLSMMDPHQPRPPFTDPGFAERAARFSALGGGRNFTQFNHPEGGKLSSNNEIPMRDGIHFNLENRELGNSFSEAPSPSGCIGGTRENNSKKRKAAVPKSKGKQAAAVNPPKVAKEDSDPKRSRSSGSGDENEAASADTKPKNEQKGKETNAKAQEAPKDYIHVRARRGQATDSHSLAERVRREKISERMKFLQDLVPGCNKVTGKAVMLDEIINYVQSLQRQVEFLSMKLATVNPRLDVNMENFIPKEMNQGPITTHSVYPIESAGTEFSYIHHPQVNPLQSVMANRLQSHYSGNLSMQMPQFDGFGDATSQLGTFWEDDLQTVVQMGFVQNQDVVYPSSQSLQGSLSSAHMKVEH